MDCVPPTDLVALLYVTHIGRFFVCLLVLCLLVYATPWQVSPVHLARQSESDFTWWAKQVRDISEMSPNTAPCNGHGGSTCAMRVAVVSVRAKGADKVLTLAC